MAEKHFLAFLWNEKTKQAMCSRGLQMLTELKSEDADFFEQHDAFYAPEIANGGLTLEQAVCEVLESTFTRDDPNETALPYSNAFLLLCKHLALDLPVIAHPGFESVRRHSPELDCWMSSLRECAIFPPAINSPMVATVDQAKTFLESIATMPQGRSPKVAELTRGIARWCKEAVASGSSLVIFIIDSCNLFSPPASRFEHELKALYNQMPLPPGLLGATRLIKPSDLN